MTQSNLSLKQEREADRLRRRHAAAEARSARLDRAIEDQDLTLQGQKVWVIPAFDADEDEIDYISHAVRTALPEYHCELAHAPGVTDEDIYQLMASTTPTADDRLLSQMEDAADDGGED